MVALKSGKNRREQIEFEGFLFDSREEVNFYIWLKEAVDFGMVSEWEYQPKSFTLFEEVKDDRGKQFMRSHVYSADFAFRLTEKWDEFATDMKVRYFAGHKRDSHDGRVWVDTKGTFIMHGGDRSFSINQKWVYQKFGTYVSKVVVDEFFSKVWLPERCRTTLKLNKVCKKYSQFKSYSEKIAEYEKFLAEHPKMRKPRTLKPVVVSPDMPKLNLDD